MSEPTTIPLPPEVVAAVAKAILDQCDPEIGFYEMQPAQQEHLRKEARAAIAEYLKQTGGCDEN